MNALSAVTLVASSAHLRLNAGLVFLPIQKVFTFKIFIPDYRGY